MVDGKWGASINKGATLFVRVVEAHGYTAKRYEKEA